MLITHDMGVIAEAADRVAVMYAGKLVELGTVRDVLTTPRHPYTQGLIACVPHIQADMGDERHDLTEVPGIVPSLRDFGKDQCLFASRCQHRTDECLSKRPAEHTFGNGQIADCWHAEAL